MRKHQRFFLTRGMKRPNLYLKKLSVMLAFKIYLQREFGRRESIQESMGKVRARGKLNLIHSNEYIVNSRDILKHQQYPC